MSTEGQRFQVGTLKRKFLVWISSLILLSALGTGVALYQIHQLNLALIRTNERLVPLARYLAQLQADGRAFERELDRSLGISRWDDSRWKPTPIPQWIEQVVEGELQKTQRLSEEMKADPDAKWAVEWSSDVSLRFERIKTLSHQLYATLYDDSRIQAATYYSKLRMEVDSWIQTLEWGWNQNDRRLRLEFQQAQDQVSQVKKGLGLFLVFCFAVSVILLFSGLRALDPLQKLTALVREIAKRGLKKLDKEFLSDLAFKRNDEIGGLAREFHVMATSLLEREKTVDFQNKRLEEKNRLLKEMGALNENILKSIEDAIIVIDLRGMISQCNPEAARFLSTSVDELKGSNWNDWKGLSSLFDLKDSIRRVTETGEGHRIAEKKINGKILCAKIMPLGVNGESTYWPVTGVVILIEDQTEVSKMQQRLRQAEHLAAVGRLSAQVAHEVRNPLHAIGLETELALEEAKEEGMLRESLFSIQASVERLEMLTENYLKFSKLSSGDKKEFNILETIQKLLRQHKPQIEEMNIDVSIHSNVKPIAFGDEPAVHQVLENLISNAIQALSEVSDRKLIWTIESDQKTVTVRLEDNALGIDPETLSNLFEPFVTTKAQGTGLGLSFVKRVIDDHNGIVVGGNRAGRGAYFEFRLPLEEEVKGHQRKGSIDEQSTFS